MTSNNPATTLSRKITIINRYVITYKDAYVLFFCQEYKLFRFNLNDYT